MSRESLCEEFEHAGMAVEIHWDSDPANPREEWDNFGKMVCFHSRYSLGDGFSNGKAVNREFDSPEEFREWWEANGDGGVILPLYLYDHSGITMSCGPFSCPWDSGQVGWIYATAEMIRKEFGRGKSKRITKAARELAEKCLRQEVETYDEYLTGQVYGYVVREVTLDDEGEDTGDGEEEDSCWGFYGLDYCRDEAKAVAESMAKRIAERESPENHLAESI